jgi:hypothetical protein
MANGNTIIRIVADFPCPCCGTTGNNRPKVEVDGVWWWRCYNQECTVEYYEPGTGVVERRRESPRDNLRGKMEGLLG